MKVPALILLAQHHWENVYGAADVECLRPHVDGPLAFYSETSILENLDALSRAEVIFSGWGMPCCDEAFLSLAPKLKAIFHAAGSVRPFVTEALWARKVVVSSANRVLSVSVAEFAVAQILLSLKLTWRHARDMRSERSPVRHVIPGLYGSVVGLISVGAVARHLLVLLRPFHLRIVAYDPFLSPEEARDLGVELMSLEGVFETSHVVSVHTPALPETEGLIRGHHFSRMVEGGTFINTARGIVVNEAEMIEVLAQRADLQVLLDVTWPEPPRPDSALFSLPNVMLTPHLAGPLDGECRRLGAMAVDEYLRYRQGQSLLGEVREEMMATIA